MAIRQRGDAATPAARREIGVGLRLLRPGGRRRIARAGRGDARGRLRRRQGRRHAAAGRREVDAGRGREGALISCRGEGGPGAIHAIAASDDDACV